MVSRAAGKYAVGVERRSMSVISHVPPPPLSVAVHIDGSGVRVDVAGEVDIANAPRLRAALDDTLRASPAAVTVNVVDVTFLDSTGINTLVQAHAAASRAGATLTVINCPSIVRRVLTVTGVLELLTGER
jgi:anti-sigma B factor antagonist